MKKSQVIGGCIMLAVALLLAVLNVTLRDGQVMFMMDGVNRPWVPVIALALIGAVVLGTAGIGQPAADREGAAPVAIDPEKSKLNKRLESIAWGCFLIMLGCYALVPQTIVSRGIWSIGLGLIMLGLNAARYFKGLRMSGFTTFLGLVSLVSGALELSGLEFLEGALFFIILGAYVLIKPVLDRRELFGKAEAE